MTDARVTERAASGLRVTAIEVPASWGRPHDVLAEVDDLLAEGPPTDLVLLPEASLTGYVSPRGDFDLRPFAIDGSRLDAEPLVREIAAVAARRGVHLVAPLVLAEAHADASGTAFFNAAAHFGPAGERAFVYRKRHPWIPETWATPGAAPNPRVRIGSFEVTICICFDIHFVEDEAAATLGASDVLLFPSAWVEEEDSRRERLVALATRHHVAVVNANWAEGVVRVPGQGGSFIVDAEGRVVAQASSSSSSSRARAVAPGLVRADATLAPMGKTRAV